MVKWGRGNDGVAGAGGRLLERGGVWLVGLRGGGTWGCDLASDGGRLQQSGSPRPLRDERGSRQTHRHLAARVERVVQVLLKTHQRINEL